MFLSSPTIEELMQLDMPTLIDMLVERTANYTQLVKTEAFPNSAIACKESILNLQEAIERKRKTQQDRKRKSGGDPTSK